MASKNDKNFIAFCDELLAYVEEHHHFPVRHTTLNNKIRYVRKKINAGTLEDWKLKMFMEIADMRAIDAHTGGRRKILRLDSTGSPTKAQEPDK